MLIAGRDIDDDGDYSDRGDGGGGGGGGGGSSISNNNNIKFMVLTYCHIVICFESLLAFLSATILDAAGFVFGKCAQHELCF